MHIFATSNSLHSYARPPQASSSAPSPARSHMRERRRVRVQPFTRSQNTPTSTRCTVKCDIFVPLNATPQASSESESGSVCMSSLSDDDDMGWSHSWPSTVWHCFLKGTEWHKRSASQTYTTWGQNKYTHLQGTRHFVVTLLFRDVY